MISDDMDEVITRGVLRDELSVVRTEIGELRTELRAEIGQVRTELHDLAQSFDQKFIAIRALIREDTQHTMQVLLEQMRREQRLESERMSALFRADTHQLMHVLLEQMQREQRLALEPTADLPERVSTLEAADLPSRTARLERAVFPPKRARRRLPR